MDFRLGLGPQTITGHVVVLLCSAFSTRQIRMNVNCLNNVHHYIIELKLTNGNNQENGQNNQISYAEAPFKSQLH